MWYAGCVEHLFQSKALSGAYACQIVFNQTSRLNPKSVAEVMELVKTTRNKTIVGNYLLNFSEFLQTRAGMGCTAKGDYLTHITNWLTVIKRDQVPHPYHLIYIGL
jgi:hypothetical protein